MNWRLIIFGGILLTLGLALAKPAIGLVQTMRINRATYEVNRNATQAARYTLAPMQGIARLSEPVNRVLGEVLAREGNFIEAYSILEGGRADRESQFWRGVSSYRLDELTSAAQHFNNAVHLQGRLSAEYRQLAELGTAALSSAFTGFQVGARPNFNNSVLQQVWSELAGWVAVKNGDWTKAASAFGSALGVDKPTGHSRLLACFAYLLAGQYIETQEAVEFSENPARLLVALERHLAHINDTVATTSTDVADLSISSEIQRRVERALAWVKLQRYRLGINKSNLDVESWNESSDPLIQYFGAEASELGGKYSEAYQTYMTLCDAHSNLSARLRAHDLASDLPALLNHLMTFGESDPKASFLMVEDMHSTGGEVRPGYLHLGGGGEIGLDYETDMDGIRRISIVASAIRADAKGAVIQLRVGLEQPKKLYIAREGWDCYTREVQLIKGSNQISIKYSANADETESEENRGVNILGILIQEKVAPQFERP